MSNLLAGDPVIFGSDATAFADSVRGMRATVKDVARLAQVSPKTVSNVVNGTTPVSHSMRARVEAAMLELDYVPNLSARALRNGRSGLIALALPDLSTPYSAEMPSTPAGPRIACGVTFPSAAQRARRGVASAP
jgi:hypothetical protein